VKIRIVAAWSGMPAESFPSIKKDFKSYTRFLKRKKPLESGIITFAQEQYKRLYSGNSKIPSESGRLHGTVAMDDHKNYTLRIFTTLFEPGPCFRFCSSGRVHINQYGDKKLKEFPVTTPHFHKVDKRGVMVAYKGPLSDPKIEAQTKNYQFGLNLFCQESKVVSPNGSSVAIQLTAAEMDLSTDDPLGDINFPTR
jgi:hypothetical protein